MELLELGLKEAVKQLEDLKQNQLSFIPDEDYPSTIENEFYKDATAIDVVLNKLENDEKIIDYIFKQIDVIGADCTDLAIRVKPEYQECRKSNSFNCSRCMKNYIENILETKECNSSDDRNCRQEKLGCEGCYYYK